MSTRPLSYWVRHQGLLRGVYWWLTWSVDHKPQRHRR